MDIASKPLVAIAIALAGMVAAARAAPMVHRLPVHVGGRVVAERDGVMSFGWPGTYFEASFHGTGVRARFEAPQDTLSLLIDGRTVRVFPHPGPVDLTIDNLPPGNHVVRLEKLTESQRGGSRFTGFFPVAGGFAKSWRPLRRQIEFIGDSFTVGYGNTSTTVTCSEEDVHDRTDTQRAFGPLVARHFGADYRINAYSGFGVVRNYGGATPSSSLPSIYLRLKPDRPETREAAAPGWRPRMIVINLGTNDFSTPLKAGERWLDDAALREDYRVTYAAFVRSLAARQPQAHFVLMGSPAFLADVEQVAATVNGRHGHRVTAIRFDGLRLNGCNFHPSLADHQRLATLVEDAIDALGTWSPRSRREASTAGVAATTRGK